MAAAMEQIAKVEIVGCCSDIEIEQMRHSIAAIEKLVKVDTVDKGKNPFATQEQIKRASQEHITLLSIEEIKKCLNLEHWADEDVKKWQDAMRAKVAQWASSDMALEGSQVDYDTYSLLFHHIDDKTASRLAELKEYRERRRALPAQRIASNPVSNSGQIGATTTIPLIETNNGREDVKRSVQVEEYRKRRGRLGQQYKAEADKVSYLLNQLYDQ